MNDKERADAKLVRASNDCSIIEVVVRTKDGTQLYECESEKETADLITKLTFDTEVDYFDVTKSDCYLVNLEEKK